MAIPYDPFLRQPTPDWELQIKKPFVGVPVKCSVVMTVSEVIGGFLLCVNAEGERISEPRLCVGAESIEAGVRAVLTHLVSKGLEK